MSFRRVSVAVALVVAALYASVPAQELPRVSRRCSQN